MKVSHLINSVNKLYIKKVGLLVIALNNIVINYCIDYMLLQIGKSWLFLIKTFLVKIILKALDLLKNTYCN